MILEFLGVVKIDVGPTETLKKIGSFPDHSLCANFYIKKEFLSISPQSLK